MQDSDMKVSRRRVNFSPRSTGTRFDDGKKLIIVSFGSGDMFLIHGLIIPFAIHGLIILFV